MILIRLFVFLLLWTSTAQAEIPASLQELPAETRQAILVRKTETPIIADLSTWERNDKDEWNNLENNIPAVLGRNGLASALEKKEGDGHTPSGVFAIKRAFGYESDAMTGLEYKQVGPDDLWIDDPASPDYNRWVKAPTEAKSFEKLKRDDDLYQQAIVIEYNTEPVEAGKGSAIFLHRWRSPDSPTAGCVAVSKYNLWKLLGWLDAQKNPKIIVQYD